MRSVLRFSSLLALIPVVAGCSEGAIDPGDPLAPISETLMEGAVTFAIPVGDGAILADTADGLLLFDSVTSEGAIVGDPGELGDVRSVARVDGATLISAESGVFIIGDSGIFASPITESLGAETEIRSVVATPRIDSEVSDLWILTSTGLLLYRDNEARPVDIDGVTWDSALIATAPIRRSRSVWVASEGRIVELWMRDGALHAGEVQLELTVDQMVADGRGYLWLRTGDVVHALRTDRRLITYDLPFAATGIYADPGGPDLWIQGAGEVWHHARGTFRPVEGIPAGSALGAGANGVLLVSSSSGLSRLRARHQIALAGVEDGARIADTTNIEILAEDPESVTEVTAALDGEDILVSGDPPTITVAPDEVGFGAHTLDVTVKYGDGTLDATLRVVFQVGVDATWAEHVRPIYQARCAMCHGAAGPAPTLLDSRQLWQENITTIIDNTRDGRMPLGGERLDGDTIALIEAWAATGFPE